MTISAQMVKELRGKSGVAIMECKEALKKTNGNIEEAIVYLRKRGIDKASKKMDRKTSEGSVSAYIHQGNKIGVLLELNCETDFVANTDQFKALSKEICMHIAASSPLYLKREDVPADLLDKEKEIYAHQAKESGKPDNIIEKIVVGKLEKYFQENCLLEQQFVMDQETAIQDLIKKRITELGENISLKRFVRYSLGE